MYSNKRERRYARLHVATKQDRGDGSTSCRVTSSTSTTCSRLTFLVTLTETFVPFAPRSASATPASPPSSVGVFPSTSTRESPTRTPACHAGPSLLAYASPNASTTFTLSPPEVNISRPTPEYVSSACAASLGNDKAATAAMSKSRRRLPPSFESDVHATGLARWVPRILATRGT